MQREFSRRLRRLVLACGLLTASPAPSAWKIETVDQAISGGANALVMPPDGKPLVAYDAWRGKCTKWAVRDAQGWKTGTLDHDVKAGHITGIIMPSGKPAFAYADWQQRSVRTAVQAEGGWQVKEWATGPSTSDAANLTSAPDGRVYFGYFDLSLKRFQFFEWVEEAWVERPGFEGIGDSARMSASIGGSVGLIYHAGNRLEMRTYQNGGWSAPTVVSSGPSNRSASVHGNADGRWTITYGGPNLSGLHVKSGAPEEWTHEIVRNGKCGRSARIKRAPDGDWHLLHYQEADPSNAVLEFLVNGRDKGWSSEVVADHGGAAYQLSLAYDAKNRPIISYYDLNERCLKVAFRQTPVR